MTRTSAAPKGLVWLVAGSFAVHAAVVGIVLAAASFAPSFEPPPRAMLVTKLVRLGVERPKEMLPRLDTAPPPPPPPPPPAAVPQAPPAPAPPTPAPPKTNPTPGQNSAAPAPVSAKDRIKELSRTKSALDRLKQHVDGQADGSVDGDSDVAVEGDRYTTLLYKCIQQSYAHLGKDEARVAGRTAQVIVKINGDGTIASWAIERSSGLPSFDEDTIRAVQGCHKIEPPPSSIRDKVRREGVEINFTP